MKRSSNWSNLRTLSFRRPRLSRSSSALLTAWLFVSMTACASPDPIPPRFDAIERYPVHTILVHGHRMAYLDEGDGLPVILIHGFGGSMWQWEYQQSLSRHLRVITPDLLGSGLSDKPDIAYRPDQMLDAFVGFMDALDIPQAVLVGNSMGAGLAIGMALTHPDRVSRLVLIDGLPHHVLDKLSSPTMRRALESGAPSWLVSFGNWLFGGLVMESVLKELVYDHTLLTPAVLERSNRNRQRPGMIGPMMTARDNLPRWESGFAMRLGEIRHPTLILWGEEDRVFPIAVGEEVAGTISGSRLVRVPKAGHIPQWEQPAFTNEAMVEFIHSHHPAAHP